jgi:nitrogen fixation protein FixH
MHMAVFLATATVLTLIGGRKPGTGKPLHWGPKIIIGFFLILFVIDGSLLMISGQGVPPVVAKWLLPPGKNSAHPTTHTAFSGVVSHGEEAAKTINQFMSNAEKQRKLGWEIAIVGLDELRQGSPSTVSVTAHDTNARALQGAQVKVAIARPGLVQPAQLLELHETDPGVYRGTLTMELPGVWVLAVQLQRGKDLFEQQQHISVSAAR